MTALDIVVDVHPDGSLSASGEAQLAAHRRVLARGLAPGATLPLRVQQGAPLRSTRANALLWAVYGRVSLAYTEAGRAMHPEALHIWFKGLYLPAVAAEVERETGEVLDVERWIAMPDGSRHRTLTTTALTRGAFPLYLEHIAADDDVQAMGVDLSDLLGESRGVRSGRCDEPDELRTMPYPAPPVAPAPTREARPVRTYADLF